MHSDDSADRLRDLLVEAGVDLEHPTAADVERTWAVWRRFAEEPVEDVPTGVEDFDEENDAVLAQHGVYDWGGGEFFELDLTRQLAFFDEDGEHDHYAQLRCTFRFAPTDELRALGEHNLWSFGMPLEDFFARALDLPGFAGVRALAARPATLDIGYDDV